MIVKDAKEAARRWVMEEAGKVPGFCGAFHHGSTNWLAEDAVLPAASDVDVMVVLDTPSPPNAPGKFSYRDVILEVSFLPSVRIQSAERVLGDYQIAGSFRAAGIISDPSGRLTRLQAAVSRDYAKRSWVVRRCEHAGNNVLNFLQAFDESDPLHAQVNACLFAAGVTTHVLLVAGLKNPTVRRRYLATRELLMEYGLLDFYEPLLEMLGCARMSRGRAEQHLAALTKAFDAARTVIKTPYRFAADISAIGRPIAIDGSRDLIERGCHREAVFWMAATYSRCQQVLSQDASAEMQERLHVGYRRLLADLGIASLPDRQQRGQQIATFLPHVWEVAETIMGANPAIEDEPDSPTLSIARVSRHAARLN